MLTIAQAFANWELEIKPTVIAQYSADDMPALSESWNDYTDSLCKDGELSDLQYHYCPAWDDEIPDDDREFILSAMGVTMRAMRAERPDASEWGEAASHWRVTLKRNGKSYSTHYSMGAALTGSPELCDVLYCLISDAESAGESFDDWCANFGYDTDSRKAERTWKACKRVAASLSRLFTNNELDALRELFADY